MPAALTKPTAGRSSTRRSGQRDRRDADWAAEPTALLQNLANRGAFRGFTATRPTASRATFVLRWHRDQTFDLLIDAAAKTVHARCVLPSIPPRSTMDLSYRRFLQEMQSRERPAHRRIEPRKVTLQCANRRGEFSVTLHVRDGDYTYATRKLIAVIDESYLLFLTLDDNSEYMVQHLGANPDWGK